MIAVQTLERRVLFSVMVPATAADANLTSFDTPVLAVPQASVMASNAASSGDAVKVFAWHEPRDTSSFNGMIWAYVYADPVAEAERVAPILQARPQGHRVVYLAYMMDFAYQDLDRADPAPFIANGPDTAHERNWNESFFNRLKALGAPLDRVAVDSEHNFTTWYLLDGKSGAQATAAMQRIYSDPAAFANLPVEVQGYSPDDYADYWRTARGRAATVAWNQWVSSVGAQAIRQAVVEPLAQAYGTTVGVSNYGDMAVPRDMNDRNGWPDVRADMPIPGNTSSPEAYIWTGLSYDYLQKDWRWNRLIAVLNTVRACQEVPGTTVTPWISYPSFSGDNVPRAQSTWLWEQMLRHLTSGGIDSFYYWNPSSQTSAMDDQMADWLFQRLEVGTPSAATLQPIAFDAEVIVTGGVRTTYAEFLTYVDLSLTKRLDGIEVFVGPTLPPVEVSRDAFAGAPAVASGTASASAEVELSRVDIASAARRRSVAVQASPNGAWLAPQSRWLSTLHRAVPQRWDLFRVGTDQVVEEDLELI